jgi:hypothetical protein
VPHVLVGRLSDEQDAIVRNRLCQKRRNWADEQRSKARKDANATEEQRRAAAAALLEDQRRRHYEVLGIPCSNTG